MRIKQQLCDYGRRSDIPGFFQTIEYSFSPAVSSTVSVLIVGRKHTLYHLKIDKPIIFRYEIMSVYVGGEPYLHNRIQVIINKFSYHGIFHYYFTIFHYLLISYTNWKLSFYPKYPVIFPFCSLRNLTVNISNGTMTYSFPLSVYPKFF